MRRWWHRACEAQLLSVVQERDRGDTERFRLQKQYDALQAAYQSLAASVVIRMQPPTLFTDLFEEAPLKDGTEYAYLTPTREERDGEEVPTEGATS